MSDLISEIQAFCRAKEISETRFGELALNDKPFVGQLRSGRRLWPETEEKVRAFMATYEPTTAEKAA